MNRIPMVIYSLRLSAWHARQARLLGGGNMSKGVRQAIEAVANKKEEPRLLFPLDAREKES